MNFSQLVDRLSQDTQHSLTLFLPELCLCAGIVLMLLVRVFAWGRRVDAFFIALAAAGVGLWFCLEAFAKPELLAHSELFTGLLVYDRLTVFFRGLLMAFLVLFALLTRLSGIPDREDGPDFYTLVLGATLGMCLMASANHLLTVFLAVEMASVPSYALAGMLKGRRLSSEAALKYSIYGAGTAGVMLYGISLLAGVLGSCHMPTMAAELSALMSSPELAESQMVLALGGLMVMVGLAFKLSAVPFHFWCPDVFEGASAEVNAFLSVASKAAALALLVRVAVGLGYAPADRLDFHESQPRVQQANAAPAQHEITPVAVTAAAETAHAGGSPVPGTLRPLPASLQPVRNFMALLVAFMAAITCTFGNLAAYGQTNIKRLLAYSTIAHAGYMMMPVAAALFLAGEQPEAAELAIGAIAFYVAVYLFMNLGAFAIVAFLRNALRSEEIDDYAGLVRACPGLVVCLGVILFSLVGLPPLAGFAAKWAVFAALFRGIEAGAGSSVLWTLLIVAGLNTALSLFYYVRVMKVMTMDPPPEQRLPVSLPMVSLRGAYVFAVTAPVVVLGVYWNDLYVWTMYAAEGLLR